MSLARGTFGKASADRQSFQLLEQEAAGRFFLKKPIICIFEAFLSHYSWCMKYNGALTCSPVAVRRSKFAPFSLFIGKF